MDILQNDIFGKKHNTKIEKEKKQSGSSSKKFPTVTLKDGINETQVASDAMLNHRVLEKKLIYSGLTTSQQRQTFMKIVKNELSIKAGLIDAATATRDSLISFFVKK